MGINVNPANLNQVVQTTVNQAVRAIEEEYLFDGQNAADNTNETNSSIGTDIVNVVTELLPSLVSTLVNTILEQLGLKQKPSEPQQPAQPVVPESPKGVIEELESQKAQLEADKAVAEQEYVEAMNNRHLMLSIYSSPNSQNRVQVNLTYDSLTAGLNGSPQYRLVDPQTGKVVVANMDEVEKNFLLGDDCIYMPELKNFQVLQKALQDGTLGIQKLRTTIEEKWTSPNAQKPTVTTTLSWEPVKLSAMPDVSSELYTQDDAAATAKYEASVAKIESEIKKIDIQIAVEKAETPEIKALELQKLDILKSNEQISQEYVEAMNNHTTADDNAAMAKYEATTLQNQAKMKELDVRIAEAKTRYAQELSIKNAAEKAETPEIKELELQKLEILESNQKASEEYVEALNNRHLMLSVYSSPNTHRTTKVELTYENLTSGVNGSQLYRLVDPQTGKVVVTTHYESMEQMFMENESVVMPELKDPKVLQKALQDGTLSIQKSNVGLGFGSPNMPVKTIIQPWETIELSSMPDVSSELYTDDDNAAMAKYETTVLKNQAKMKELDVKIAQAKEKYAQEIKADKTVNNKEPEETEEQQVVQKDYTARQVERYEKYIAKYEKQIDLLENSNDPNKQAKISALMDKIEKYMNKINQLID